MDRRTRSELRVARDEIVRSFLGKRDINGMGVGYRFVRGSPTDEPAVIVGVTKKREPGFVPDDRLLPESVLIKGRRYRVDVVEAGPFRMNGDVDFEPGGPTDPFSTEHFDPPAQASQVMNANASSWGTMGPFVRDLSDGTLGFLTNNHVLIERNSEDSVNDPVRQGSLETIAHVKRFVPFKESRFVSLNNTADVSLAEFVDQDTALDESFYRMAPISESHPFVGLYFASDVFHFTGLICKADNVLSQIGCELLDPEAVTEVLPLSRIEKCGARTGYSSSLVGAVDWVGGFFVEFDDGHTRPVVFHDLILTFLFGWSGDSGSPVCAGGDGHTWLPLHIPEWLRTCRWLDAAGDMYDLPLSQDHAFADQVRDEFFAHSLMGQLLTTVFYKNGDVLLDRMSGQEATDSEKSGAATYYDRYHDFFIDALQNPDQPGLVVTQRHLDDAAAALEGLKLRMTPDEKAAADLLHSEILTPTLGFNRRQLIQYMNNGARTRRVWDIFAEVDAMQISGPYFPDLTRYHRPGHGLPGRGPHPDSRHG